MSFKVSSHTPDALVTFFSYKKENTYSSTFLASDTLSVEEINVTSEIISIQTNKGKSGVGTWSVTLASSKNYKGLISPGSWCMIYMGGHKIDIKDNSTHNGLKMVGIVKSVRRQEAVDGASGTKYVRYVVSGEDFQSFFNIPIYINQTLVGDTPLLSLALFENSYRKKLKGFDLGPDRMIEVLLETLLGPISSKATSNKGLIQNSKAVAGGSGMPIHVPPAVAKRVLGSASPSNYFSTMITYFLTGGLLGRAFPMPDLGGTTPIWSVLQSFSNSIFNEIYTELLPTSVNGVVRLVPSFVLRAIPFSSDKMRDSRAARFFDIPNHTNVKRGAGIVRSQKTKKNPVPKGMGSHYYISKYIEENEIMGLNTGKSDAERFNFFFVVPSIIEGNAVPEADMIEKALKAQTGFNSYGNTASLKRYGLRPFISYSNYFLDSNQGDMTKIAQDLWNRAHLFENGMVTIIGSHEHIPVGTNIVFPERDWIAHVERVSHEFDVRSDGDKSFKTSLSFSRLQKLSTKSPIDLTENMDNPEAIAGQLGEWDRGFSFDDSGGNE
jgi:hypothetical protein